MRNVSKQFKENCMDTDKIRAAKAMVEFCIVEEAGEYSEECSPYYGFVSQILDEENEQIDWATCEPGRFRLDGSMCIPNYSDKFKYGYISKAMSDAAGKIDVKLRISFVQQHITKGVTICFQEPVHDFSITIGGKRYEIVDNKAKEVYVEHITAYQEIELSIKKLEPFRRVRISQIFLGAVMSYDDEKIVSLDVVNEISFDNTSLPSDSTNFSIMNLENEFDILNPEGLHKYLKENQPVNVYLAIKTDGIYEYARIGRYFINEWSTSDMQAKFTAYTVIYGMDEDEYRFGRIEYRTLYEMIDELLDDVGVEHIIDESLKRLTVSGYISTVKKREALRQMIQTGCCVAVSDSRGRIVITKRSKLPQKPNEYEKIDGYNIIGDWPTMKQKKNYASAEVTINTFTAEEEESVVYEGAASITGGELQADGKYKVWVAYKEKPAKDINIQGIAKYEAYACGAYVYIAEDTQLTITGKKVSVSQTSYEMQKYNYDNPIKISNNLIITESNAAEIAEYALLELNMTTTASYTGFPHLEAGDPVEVETQFGNKDMFLTKSTLSYNGALSGKLEGVGKID
jgi:hypothetical protein